MPQPWDPDATIWLSRHDPNCRPEDADLDLVFGLVAQLITDLHAWSYEESWLSI